MIYNKQVCKTKITLIFFQNWVSFTTIFKTNDKDWSNYI